MIAAFIYMVTAQPETQVVVRITDVSPNFRKTGEGDTYRAEISSLHASDVLDTYMCAKNQQITPLIQFPRPTRRKNFAPIVSMIQPHHGGDCLKILVSLDPDLLRKTA